MTRESDFINTALQVIEAARECLKSAPIASTADREYYIRSFALLKLIELQPEIENKIECVSVLLKLFKKMDEKGCH